jgi:hypothetical protein
MGLGPVAMLRAMVGLDANAYKAGANDVRKENERMRQSIASVGKAMGIAFSVVGLIQIGKSIVEWAKNVSIAADSVGILTKEMMGLEIIGRKNNLELNMLQMMFQRVQVKINEAAAKGGVAEETFEKLGIKVRDLVQMNPSEQFLLLARASFASANPIATINELFGELGRKGTAALRMIAENGLPAVSDAAGKAADDIKKVYQEFQKATNFLERNVIEFAVAGVKPIAGAVATVREGLEGLGELLMGDLDAVADVAEARERRLKEWYGNSDEERAAEAARQQAEMLKTIEARIADEIAAERAKTEVLKQQAAERFKALGIDRSGIERMGAIFGGASAAGMAMRDRETVLAQQQLQLTRQMENNIAKIMAATGTIVQRVGD